MLMLCWQCHMFLGSSASGPMTVTRTCSSSLDLRMPISHVCMLESRPGDGHLCFCGRDNCNHGNSLHGNHNSFIAFIVTLLAILLLGNGHHVTIPPLLRLWTPTKGNNARLALCNYVSQYTVFWQRHRENDIKDLNTGWQVHNQFEDKPSPFSSAKCS